MEKRELTCIGCPMGCPLTVELENGAVTAVYGNTCPRGDAYARRGAGAQGCDRGRPGDHRAGRAAQRRRHRRGCDRHKKCGSKVSGEAPSDRGLFSFRCSQSLCYENNFPEKVKYWAKINGVFE